MTLSTPIVAAIDRLKNFYNGLSYNAATNPGGMGNGGNRRNFEPALKDLADVAGAVTAEISAQVAAAATSATAAATLAGTGISGTSTSTLTVTTGAKSLTVQTGRAFVAGHPVKISDMADPSRYMTGTVTAYDATTGVLAVAADTVAGSGSGSAWAVFVSVKVPEAPDVGGGADATITTSTTLAASASVVQSVDMATAGQSVRLPDAMTLTKGGRKFVVLNIGNRTAGVRDNAGTLLTVVPAGAAAELHLRANTTAAGLWGVTGRGLEPALTLVDHTAPTATVTTAMEIACRLTDTLSLHFAYTTAGGAFYVAAVDSTPGAAVVGPWTLVESSQLASYTAYSHCFRISDTQAIVFWAVNGGSHKANVLTVDPATKAITPGTQAGTTTAFLTNVTFTGRPVIAQLTPTLYAVIYNPDSGQTRAMAVQVNGTTALLSGTPPLVGVAGSSGTNMVLGCYRISDTQAMALYYDDSGTVGGNISIRGAVLTVAAGVSPTIGVGTSAGINDVASPSYIANTCQLSPARYLVAYNNGNQAVAHLFTVSGATVTMPATWSGENIASLVVDVTRYNSNRFQPNLYAIDSNRALLTYGITGGTSRHIVLSESGGNLTGGTLHSNFWDTGQATGGNFPQTPAGFLVLNGADTRHLVMSVTINGTSLEITGMFADGGATMNAQNSYRFGLSGGVYGIVQFHGTVTSSTRVTLMHLFRFRPNAPPQYLGALRVNNLFLGYTPVEIAANKVALTQGIVVGSAAVRLQIVEFAQ